MRSLSTPIVTHIDHGLEVLDVVLLGGYQLLEHKRPLLEDGLVALLISIVCGLADQRLGQEQAGLRVHCRLGIARRLHATALKVVQNLNIRLDIDYVRW